MKLLPHQTTVLTDTEGKDHVAYYLDMGLGKTYIGSEKLISLQKKVNLVICQKSKVKDWIEHFTDNYVNIHVLDLTNKKQFEQFVLTEYGHTSAALKIVCIINYELAWRRKELLNLSDFTLMLDESSLIQNSKAKQTKFILKLQPAAVILLSGTPTAGKYENLWTQAHLLGWDISKDIYDNTYVLWRLTEDDGSGIRHKIVDGYKNVDRLKSKFRQYGAVFMKTEEVLDLPDQTFIPVMIDRPKLYTRFMKESYIEFDGIELIGDSLLTKRLYARQLVSQYNPAKIEALTDLIQSTSDRLVIFYNFNAELDILKGICNAQNRPVSQVNGSVKDLSAYEDKTDSITLVQFQAGAMGLNLQKCSKVIYFSLPERSELFEQSKKRVHRIGQLKSCFYWLLLTRNSIDEAIYSALQMRKDYTDELFRENI